MPNRKSTFISIQNIFNLSTIPEIQIFVLTRSTLTYGEAQNLDGEFHRRWREVEKFQRPVPEGFVQRVRASASALRSELDRLQRQRRLKIVAASAAALVVIVAGAWFAIGAMRAQDYATQLGGLRDAGQVEAAEKMIADVRKDHPALARKPKLSARLDEVDRWTRDERAKLAEIESRLTDLEATTKAGMAEADPMALATKLESTGQLIEAVAGGLSAAPSGRILVVRNEFEAHVTVLREKLIAQADGELTVKGDATSNTITVAIAHSTIVVPRSFSRNTSPPNSAKPAMHGSTVVVISPTTSSFLVK